MEIINFTTAHIEQATQMALQNYMKERSFVPSLPLIENVPDLSAFADNDLGVTAFENNKMIGYLCSFPAFDNAFGITGLKGIWSPLYAHAAISENRKTIYPRMYQAAAQKWVAAGAVSHSITLYAHDAPAQEGLFQYGFGMRCIDAICLIGKEKPIKHNQFQYSELDAREAGKMTAMRNLLIDHMGPSPCFMNGSPMSEQDAVDIAHHRNSRIFIISDKEKIISFIEITDSGETFVSAASDMMNICGAYLMPEFRGQGIYEDLLAYLMNTLKKEGYLRLGVDCESINPTAYGFWLKHFDAYTHSVVRRIDEKG